MAAGALMILGGLARRSLAGGLVSVVGGLLFERGRGAYCPIYDRLGVSTNKPETPAARIAAMGQPVPWIR
jgi:uncharacterized membrane protein